MKVAPDWTRSKCIADHQLKQRAVHRKLVGQMSQGLHPHIIRLKLHTIHRRSHQCTQSRNNRRQPLRHRRKSTELHHPHLSRLLSMSLLLARWTWMRIMMIVAMTSRRQNKKVNVTVRTLHRRPLLKGRPAPLWRRKLERFLLRRVDE